MATGTITSLGMGSSLDLQSMLDTLREADEAVLNLKQEEIEEKTAVKEQLNSVLNQMLSMKTSALYLSLSSNYLYRSVTVSDTDVARATAYDGTATGSHGIETTRLASRSSYISGGYASSASSVHVPTVRESTEGFSDADIVLAEGEMLEISHGPENNPRIFTITGAPGGMTAADLTAAVNGDAANRDAHGNPLVTATTYADTDTGKTHIRIEAASGETGEEQRVSVSGSVGGGGFAAPVSDLSFSIGDGDTYAISVPAETSLEGLAERINEDDGNPGVTASVIYTGTGDNPYQLVLEADNSGEDSRIAILDAPPGLVMTEKNGSGYAMTGDTAISFDSPVTIDAGNNTLIFRENGGDDRTATIAQGDYDTPEELAEAVEKALENESKRNGNNKDFQVDIDSETGAMTITESGTLEEFTIKWEDTGSTAASVLGFSGTLTVTPAASSLNSEVVVNGVSFHRQENSSLTDIVAGVSLTLYATGATTFSIENSTETIHTEIAGLVETYNSLLTEIDENDDYDMNTDTWGTLARSSTAGSLKQVLQDLFSTTVDTGGSITSLLDLGMEFRRDGTITFDEDTLNAQLSENFEAVMNLFLGTGTTEGLADILNKGIGNYALSDGYIDGEIDAVDTKVNRLESHYKREIERLDKKYEILARQYTALDTYLAEIESVRSYINSVTSAGSDDD